MKRLAAIAQHLTVLNLVLAGILLVVTVFVLEPFLMGVQMPQVVPNERQAAKPEPQGTFLQEYLFLSDLTMYFHDAWLKYLALSFGEDAVAIMENFPDGKPDDLSVTSAPPLQDYLVIAEQNLFHPERRVPPLTADVPKPEFVLYGTLVSDTIRIAYLSDKKAVRTSPGRGNRQNSLKPGESLSGYQLKEVHQDYIVMVRGDDVIQVRVIAPGTKKERSADVGTPATTIAPAPGMNAPVTVQPPGGTSPFPNVTPVSPSQRTVPSRRGGVPPSKPVISNP